MSFSFASGPTEESRPKSPIPTTSSAQLQQNGQDPLQAPPQDPPLPPQELPLLPRGQHLPMPPDFQPVTRGELAPHAVVCLTNSALWQKFAFFQNEMVVTKQGR